MVVSLARGKLHTFTVFLVTVREGNTAEYKPCDTYTGVTGDKVVEINCHGEIVFLEQFSAYWPISFTFPSQTTDNCCSGQQGQFVFIRDDRNSDEYFGVCEVTVLRFQGRECVVWCDLV